MIDTKQVAHIAKLARLELSEKETQQFSEQLSKVMDNFAKIEKVNTQGIEPLVTPTDMPAFWREDIVIRETTAEEIVANAPERTGHLFKVPPVV